LASSMATSEMSMVVATTPGFARDSTSSPQEHSGVVAELDAAEVHDNVLGRGDVATAGAWAGALARWMSPSADDRAKQSPAPWCDCRPGGSAWPEFYDTRSRSASRVSSPPCRGGESGPKQRSAITSRSACRG
jgi:hypothetical protein